jgi:DNA-nicking Smr family endonuclease
MKTSDASVRVKSFQDLKTLLEKKAATLPPETPGAPGDKEVKPVVTPGEPKTDREMFLNAMADVTPLPGGGKFTGLPRTNPPVGFGDDSDAMALEALKKLISHGKGFIVAQTPEYIEGRSDRVHPAILKRLHRGDFSIQAHIDLHGLTVESAREDFDKFLKASILTGKQTVLVVHGRGLSSPVKPVLKTKVQEWLTSGSWRKWVIAFSSARHCDGGAGATYVLLRRRPLTKRFRKKTGRMGPAPIKPCP